MPFAPRPDGTAADRLPGWRMLLASVVFVGAIQGAPSCALAADRSVPGTRCLFEAINTVTPRLSLACSDADLHAWLTGRGLTLSDLAPVPSAQPDGSLPQDVYRAPSGDRILLARFVSDRFFPPQPRSRESARAEYLASLGITAQTVAALDIFVPGDDLCDGEFAIAGTAPTLLSGSIKLFRHCAPNPQGPYGGRRILYIEGHTNFYFLGGIEYIRWLASLGFEVFVADLPLFGFNAPGPPTPALSHDDYIDHERDTVSPLWTEFLAPFNALYGRVRSGATGPVGLSGRSGGGISAYSLSLAQPLVDYVVSIAGGTPQSMRLAAPLGTVEVGDWEQWSPRTYSRVGHEELIRYGGRLGGLHIYGGLDPCCFRVAAGDGFYEWMRATPDDGRAVEIFVDPLNDQHALSELGKPAMTAFLDRIFAMPLLSVGISGDGTGRVASMPAGISCVGPCAVSFPPGTLVTLSATPDPGSTFTGWGGACTGTGPCTVTMDSPRSVEAIFSPLEYSVIVTRRGNGAGTVTSIPTGIDCGQTCSAAFPAGSTATLAATPATGSLFSGWGGACTGTGTCAVTLNVAEAASHVTSTFSLEQFDLTVTTVGDGTGTVTSNPSGVTCGTSCSAQLSYGTQLVLEATSVPGSMFLGWGGACVGTGPCAVTMNAARGVTAAFGVISSVARLRNISTRMRVLPGNDSLIGGFIIAGTQPKTVVVRARGPSLEPFGVRDALANPHLQLFAGQTSIGSNDDWGQSENAPAIQALGLAPSSPRESAVLARLSPGAYTAIVSGVGGMTGVGIVEVFDVDTPSSPLLNISTRGRAMSGEDVMIGGFVIQGDSPVTVIVRARGPSLAAFGVTDTLVNPTMLLFAGKDFLASNEDWVDSPDAARIQALGFAPANRFESAILITLLPGAYTAIVSDALGRPGVGIVEVFVP